mmetsp:Transcript_14906/g.32334  ORF Transcript_14906/g.32334 Transcript_14906/m.32334 type:complete len:82 (-) Transcript_14906:117-362(-)
MHGTIFRNSDFEETETSSSDGDEVAGLHVVSYNMRMIETFLRRISSYADEELREVLEKLDPRLRRIAMERVPRARKFSDEV